jgi:hypothetical protein
MRSRPTWRGTFTSTDEWRAAARQQQHTRINAPWRIRRIVAADDCPAGTRCALGGRHAARTISRRADSCRETQRALRRPLMLTFAVAGLRPAARGPAKLEYKRWQSVSGLYSRFACPQPREARHRKRCPSGRFFNGPRGT